jgi:pSer/pThr/pTyr-binding forkhead associated (FHA) protein/uncharacterized RDD family membrane protein YckC
LSQVNQVSQTGWQIFVEVPGKAPIELPNGESVIGRSRACLVQIAETTVSRQHAILVVEPGKVRLRDLGSSNGTFVNGERVDGELPLADGDRVVVGEAELVLRMLAPLGPSEATARLVIPPLTAPERTSSPQAEALPPTPVGGTPLRPATLPPMPMAPPALGAAPPPAGPRGSSTSGSHAPWTPTPLSRIPASPAAPAAAPTSAPAPAAAPAPPAGGELLSSIRDIDLAPVPPPLPRPAVVAAPAVRAATSSGKVEPAGFWLRAAASLLDGVPFVLLAVTQFIVAFYVSPSLAGIVTLVQIVYGLLVILVLPAMQGTTPGKRLLKLWIVSETTAPGMGLGWGTAALRFVGYLACSVTFGLGYLLVAFSARKQGLHDLIAKTNVVRKK